MPTALLLTGTAKLLEAASESTVLPTTGVVLATVGTAVESTMLSATRAAQATVESAKIPLILVLRLTLTLLGPLCRSPMPVAGMAQGLGPWTALQLEGAAMVQPEVATQLREAAGEARVVTAAALMRGAVGLPLTPGAVRAALMHAGAALMHVTAALMHVRAALAPGVGALQKEVAVAKTVGAALLPGAVTLMEACGWIRGQRGRGRRERSIAVAMGG